MSKSYLKQVLTYINKVCHIGKEVNNLKDKIIESPVKVSTITFVVLFGFMLQINSFNRLKYWIKRNKFNKIVPKGTQIPCIDAVRRCLSNFDLEGLKDINTNLVKTVIKNKVFRSVKILWNIMHKRWDVENNVFHQLKTEWHLDHCFLHSPTGIKVVLMFIVIAFNLMQLYFFRCLRGFRKKNMLQIDVIEDIRDERFTIEENWDNPIFGNT